MLLSLNEIGALFPSAGGYYPGEASQNPLILELLDRRFHTGVVLEGNADGLAWLNLIYAHAKYRLVLTSQSI